MHYETAGRNSTTSGTDRAQTVSLTVRSVEQRLSRGESALLLSAFLALAASMVSFVTL